MYSTLQKYLKSGVNRLFNSSAREDESEKWADYGYSFWHVSCVHRMELKAFSERYQIFCKRHQYSFQADKPAQHSTAKSCFRAYLQIHFLGKKESQRKSYYIYMTARANMFLRISGIVFLVHKESSLISKAL